MFVCGFKIIARAAGLLMGVLVALSPAVAEKRVALVIGNAAYTDITTLLKPLNDARRVAEVLRGLGYEVILGTDTNKTELDRLADRFRAALVGADVGFFFYSGHGFQTNRASQQHPVNHIVPVDFRIQDVDAALPTLALDAIMDALKRQVRVGFIFMDACRNDPQLTAASERLARGTRSITLSRGLSPVNVAVPEIGKPQRRPDVRKGPAGLLIAYATDPGNVALEGDNGSFSPFTTALVKHLSTPGLSAAEVMGRVSSDVSTETQGQQTPWNVSSLTVGTYQFLAKPITQPSTPSSSPQSSTNQRQPSAPSPQRSQPAPAAKSAGQAPSRPTNNLPPNLGGGIGAGL